MKYTKPEVVLLAPAMKAIESGRISKPEPHFVLDLEYLASDGAYEADE